MASTAYLLDGGSLNSTRSYCDFSGFAISTAIFTQHLWNLSIGVVTYLILVHPLSRITLSVERYLAWLWPVYWAFGMVVNMFGWIFVGWTDVGGFCSLRNPPGGLFTPMLQFVPRALVVVTIIVLYARLFFFLRRISFFRKSASRLQQTTQTGGGGQSVQQQQQTATYTPAMTGVRRPRAATVTETSPTGTLQRPQPATRMPSQLSTVRVARAADNEQGSELTNWDADVEGDCDEGRQSLPEGKRLQGSNSTVNTKVGSSNGGRPGTGGTTGGNKTSESSSSSFAALPSGEGSPKMMTSMQSNSSIQRANRPADLLLPVSPNQDHGAAGAERGTEMVSPKSREPRRESCEEMIRTHEEEEAGAESDADSYVYGLDVEGMRAMPMSPRKDIKDFAMSSPPIEHLNHSLLLVGGAPASAVGVDASRAEELLKAHHHQRGRRSSARPASQLSQPQTQQPGPDDFELALGGEGFSWGQNVGGTASTPANAGGATSAAGQRRWTNRFTQRRGSDSGVGGATSSGSSNSPEAVESIGTTLNRQASILMLLYPLAYCLLFSVSIIRIINDLASDPNASQDPRTVVLYSISRWFILAQGALDALIFQFVEKSFRKRMKRRRRKALGEEVEDLLPQKVAKAVEKAWSRIRGRHGSQATTQQHGDDLSEQHHHYEEQMMQKYSPPLEKMQLQQTRHASI